MGKHLGWSPFLIKLQAFRPATLSKRDSNTGVPMNIAKYLRAAFYRTPPVAASGR